jgi:GT2 family glycosyltransferase
MTELVDIIIPSYKAVEYLKITIDSVRLNTKNYRLIIVNSGDDPETRNFLKSLKDVLLFDTEEPLNFAEAVNWGLSAAQNDVVILNNDVIVGKNWLEHLKASPFDITGPFSNCDAWIHNRHPEIANSIKLKPYMSIDEVPVDILKNISSPYDDVVPADWVAFYATFIRKSVLENVGILDPKFKNGGEDIDYCRRATKLGFTCGYIYLSWVFHFGGKTRLVDEQGNYLNDYRPEDEINKKYNELKSKPTVCIHTGPAWESWTIENINKGGIGGSETCAAMLAKYLVKNGYRCVIIGDCEDLEGIYDGVEYIHHTKFDDFKRANYVDHFISSRRFAPLTHPIRNGKNYIWAHDIYVMDLPPQVPTDITFICLSPWHQNFFCEYHNISPAQTAIIGNGLDLSRYDKRDEIEKDPYRLIYSSCPSRGLLTLLEMFPKWKKEFPELTLHVFYGFDNWKKIIQQRGNPEQIAHLQAIEQNLEQEGVFYHGRVSQEQLATEQMKSALWVYPTEFRETYCITAIETMLAGAIPVCTNFPTPQGPSTLETTVPDGCGIKVADPAKCFEATKLLLNDTDLQDAYRKAGRDYVLANCGWEKVTNKWIDLFNRTETNISMNQNIPSNSFTYQQLSNPQPIKVGIGLPMLFPFVHFKFVNSYLALEKPQNQTITISLVGSLTALARNQIVDIALKQGCTHVLFLDTDMTFPPDTLKKLVAHDKDIASGLYFERYPPYRPMLRKVFEDGYSLVNYPPAGLVGCDALGSGCILIKTEVFKKIGKPYYEYRLASSGIKETFLSEDIVFCERAREAGFKIYCDTSIRCGHLISDVEISEAHWDGSHDYKEPVWSNNL